MRSAARRIARTVARTVTRFGAALVVFAAATAASADVDVRIDLGHGGRWIDECATPVNVTLRNTGSESVGVMVAISEKISLSAGPIRQQRQVFLGPGATRREPFLIPAPEAFDGGLTVEVVSEPSVPIVHEGRLASRGRMSISVQGTQTVARTAVSPSGRVVGVVGDTSSVLPSLLPNAVREELLRAGSDLVTVDALPVDARDLALAPFSLDGFDSLVVIDPDEAFLADRAVLDAVLDWVALGGLLVVSPGERSAALGATPLGPYLPDVTGPTEPSTARDVLTALARALREKVEEAPDARPLALLPLEVQEGVPTTSSGRALWADRPLGAGRVRLLAVDARDALRASRDVGHLLAMATALSGRPSVVRDKKTMEALAEFRWGSQVDIESSTANTLRQDAFEPPPAIVILGLLALYVLIVGPLDWLVLRRLGRQRLTTFTFGGAVIIFTVVAYAASFLVFSSGRVVNRIVFVDLQDAGREGRQLVRIQDLAGYYSPRGADQTVAYSLPAAVLGSSLPGGGAASEFGTSYPVLVGGTDPLEPVARVQVAFRSQRWVRSVAMGVTGRTIETSWVPAEGDQRPSLRVVNGLPVAIERCAVMTPGGGGYAVGDVPPGGEKVVAWSATLAAPGGTWTNGGQLDSNPTRKAVIDFVGLLSRLSPDGVDGGPVRTTSAEPVSLERQALLARTGIARGAALGRGNALLLATASRSPVPLPAEEQDGRTHVIIRKEIRLP